MSKDWIIIGKTRGVSHWWRKAFPNKGYGEVGSWWRSRGATDYWWEVWLFTGIDQSNGSSTLWEGGVRQVPLKKLRG